MRCATQCSLYLLALLGFAKQGVCQIHGFSSAAFNPFSGQGTPPEGTTVRDFPVNVTFATRRILGINEVRKQFSLIATMTLAWQDDRVYDLTAQPYSQCGFFCSSQSSELLNVDGQPSCCDGVYIPSADSHNALGFPSQSVPYQYAVLPLPDGLVIYTTTFSGVFSYHFDYASYPWDRHYLAIDVVTDFMPILNSRITGGGASFLYSDGVVVTSQRSGPAFLPGTQRSRQPILSVPGWQIGKTWMEVMSQTLSAATQTTRGSQRVVQRAETSIGYSVYIEINRVSRAFYAAVVIVPTALIVIFSFILFSLGRNQFKARINILLLLFLSLIILQYVLSSILPGTYTLLSPIYLVLISYIYNFLLLFTSIISYSIYMQHTRRNKKRRRRASKGSFQTWILALRRSVLPSRRVAPEEEASEEASEDMEVLRVSENGVEQIPISISNYSGGQLLLRKLTKPSPSPDTASLPPEVETKADRGKKDNQVTTSELAPDEIDDQTRQWFEDIQKKWFVRWLPFVRDLVIWYKFVGQDNSKNYLEAFSHKLEFWTRTVLFLLYLGSIGLVFGIARGKVEQASYAHVLQ